MKQHFFLLYSFFILMVLSPFNILFGKTPRIALVLSGGGIRGLAQIGVLKALDEENIRPDIIVATSMGAIIGSMYALGISPEIMDSLVTTMEFDDIFSNSTKRKNLLVSQKDEPIDYLFEIRFTSDLKPILPNSLSHGQTIYDILTPLVSAPLFHAKLNFDSLYIPLRIVATDIVTGQSIVFSKGNLVEIIRASCGIPLAFSPVIIDSMLLLDGGLTANIPVEAAIQENPDYIIAVDVTSPMWERGDLNNPIHLFDQVVAIGIDRQKQIQSHFADLIIKPSLNGLSNTDFTHSREIINRGYRAAKERASVIKNNIEKLQKRFLITEEYSESDKKTAVHKSYNLMESHERNVYGTLNSLFSTIDTTALNTDSVCWLITKHLRTNGMPFTHCIEERFDSTGRITINPGVIREVKIHGNEKTSTHLIKAASGLKPGFVVNNKSLSDALSSLYATNLFNSVTIYVDSLMAVNIKVFEKEYWRTRFGLRFDEYHLIEGFVQPAYENLFGTALCANLHIQLGKKREKYACGFSADRPWSRLWANNFSINGYISREKIIKREKETVTIIDSLDTLDVISIKYNERNLMKTGVTATLGTQLGRIVMINGTIGFERFQIEQTNVGLIEALNPFFKNGLRFLRLGVNIDDLDRSPFPRRGQKHYMSISGASDVIGGTENFINLQGRFQYFFTTKKKHTFSPLLSLSWSDQVLPLTEQTYMGGIIPDEKYRDLRVYNYVPLIGLTPRALSGDIHILFHGSYQFSPVKDIYLISVFDWGYVWCNNKNETKEEFKFNLNTVRRFVTHAPFGIGLSVAYDSVLGPIKVSWGKVISGTLPKDFDINTGNLIYFSAGHDF